MYEEVWIRFVCSRLLKEYKNSFASEETTLAYVANPTTRLFVCAPTLLLQHQW
jgi:hypothetical protein